MALGLALGLIAAGCAAGAGGMPPRQATRAPTASDEVAGPSVRAVASPDPRTATRVSLRELLAHAEQHAPQVRVAAQQAAAGDAEVEAASPLLLDNPELAVAAGGRTVGGGSFFEIETSLEQRFEIAGERGLRIEAAERQRELARAALDEARWEVHRQVHGLFAEALLARARVAAADRLVAFAEELLAIAEKRSAVGETAPLSEILARAEVAQARQERIATLQRRQAVLVELAHVVGWPTMELPELAGALPPVRKAPPLSALLAAAAAHQPSQRRRQLAVRAARARVELADREAWPEPAVGVTYAREGEAGGAAHVWLGTLSVPVPIWNRNQGERARARATLEVARAEQDAAAVRLRTAVARARGAVDAAAERAALYGTAILPAVDRNLRLVRRAYQAGELDIHQVSQIRERVLTSQRQALEARADYHAAVATLEALLGTEVWPASEGPPTREVPP